MAKFRTECDIVNIPYTEDFKSFDLEIETLPACWSYQNIMSGWSTKNCIPALESNSKCNAASYALKLTNFFEFSVYDIVERFQLSLSII